jgi:hypothetical protein
MLGEIKGSFSIFNIKSCKWGLLLGCTKGGMDGKDKGEVGTLKFDMAKAYMEVMKVLCFSIPFPCHLVV